MRKSINSQVIANHDILPEEQFIVRCLRLEFGKESYAASAPFKFFPVDWDRVYDKAIQWHIASLLYKALINQTTFLQSFDVSNDFLKKLKAAYVKTFFTNKKNYDSLVEVLDVFNKEGIEVIFLKGSFLAHFVYKDAGLRSMSDIDILVKKDDLDRAEKQLSLLGCEFLRTTLDSQVHDYLIEKHRTNHHHLHPIIHPRGTKPIEVHWTIVHQDDPFHINIEGLWERAKATQINGKKVHVLSPEDTLLNHSLHASYCNKLVLYGIRSCCDTAAIINHYQREIDWEQLQLLASEWGAVKYLYLTLRLAQEILGAAVPEDVLQNLQPKSFHEGLLLESQKRVISAKVADAVPDVKRFNPHSSFLNKIHLFLQRIFIPQKELAVCYSLPVTSKYVYFFYIVRLFSLLYSVPFILRLLINKKGDTCQNSFDLWLMFPDSQKRK